MLTQAQQERLSALNRRMERLKRGIENIQQEKLEIARATSLTCTGCKIATPLGQWTFVQIHVYIHPRGCNEGDYYCSCDIEYCEVGCPLCKKEATITYHYPELLRLIEKMKSGKWLFKHHKERRS